MSSLRKLILASVSVLISVSLTAQTTADTVKLPAPNATKSKMNFSKVQGWKDGRTPKAPEGFTVTKYADDFDNPR